MEGILENTGVRLWTQLRWSRVRHEYRQKESSVISLMVSWTASLTAGCGQPEYLWLPYGIGQAIIFSSCGFFFFLSFYLLFFLAYSQPLQTGCLPYFHTWCGLSENLRCRSETCCTQHAENTGCKKIAKNSPSGHHHTTLSGYIFATGMYRQSEKNC